MALASSAGVGDMTESVVCYSVELGAWWTATVNCMSKNVELSVICPGVCVTGSLVSDVVSFEVDTATVLIVSCELAACCVMSE